LPICPAEKAFGLEKICCVKTAQHPSANAFLIDFGVILRSSITEESQIHTVLSDKYPHLLQIKFSQYDILLRIFSLHLHNICSLKTAKHPPALQFLMDFVEASRSKIRILQGEFRHKTQKLLVAGRMI